MTNLVLPSMVARKKGLIINIASMSGIIPNPLLSLYSGTKAFVDKFTEDLNTEYKDQGIMIQSVLPGFVCSNMSKIKRPSLMAPSADTFVASALNTLGYTRHTTGYLPHAFMALIINTMSVQLLATRKKALKHEKKN
uniref:Uncharacterized protein n=1 Tax=Megaselia scalaris TaxID=36166 RepID=T1GKC5_MEGSC